MEKPKKVESSVKNSRPGDKGSFGTLALYLIVVVLAIISLWALISFMEHISSWKCSALGKPTTEVSFLSKSIIVNCETIGVDKLSTALSSWASVWTIIFLSIALFYQGREMQLQRAEFRQTNDIYKNTFEEQKRRNNLDILYQNEQLEWEKADKILQLLKQVRAILASYIDESPSKLRGKYSHSDLDSIQKLTLIFSDIQKCSRRDFISTQSTQNTIENDKQVLKMKFLVLLKLIEDPEVAKLAFLGPEEVTVFRETEKLLTVI